MERGGKCVLLKLKESWTEKGLPLKERDDNILRIISKLKQRLQSLKKNLKKMKEEAKQQYRQAFSDATVNLAPANYREVIMSNWHLKASMKQSLIAVLDDYIGKDATR